MLRIALAVETQLRSAMQRAFPEAEATLDPQLTPASKPEFGDFQANGALPLAKPLKQAPRQIAVAIVDDLLATGGTAVAATELLRKAGARVDRAAFVIDLPDLGGAARLRDSNIEVHTLLAFEGE